MHPSLLVVIAVLAFLAPACGSNSSSGTLAGGAADGLGGAMGSGGSAATAGVGVSDLGVGGTVGLPASGGVSAVAGGAPPIGAGGVVLPSAPPGTAAGGVAGAAGGGASGVSAGGAPPTDPAPYRLSLVIPTATPGEEGTQCVQQKLPNSAPLSVTKLHNTLSLGSHHFIVSVITAANATEKALAPCPGFGGAIQGGPLAISQRKDDTVTTPVGVGYALAANQMVNLELHYINTGTEPLRIEADSEIFPADSGANLEPSTVELIGTTNIFIPAQASASTGQRYIQMPSDLDGVHYFALTGHTHRLGTGVKVWSAASASASPTLLYAPMPFEWDAPVLEQLTPAVQIPTGGGFVLQCDWQNTTSNVVTIGESALSEMCFFWAYYYPKKAVSNIILEGIGPVDPSFFQTLGI